MHSFAVKTVDIIVLVISLRIIIDLFAGMYLEKKAGTGKEMDTVTYNKYLLDFKDPKWRPPLSNHCLILPTV